MAGPQFTKGSEGKTHALPPYNFVREVYRLRTSRREFEPAALSPRGRLESAAINRWQTPRRPVNLQICLLRPLATEGLRERTPFVVVQGDVFAHFLTKFVRCGPSSTDCGTHNGNGVENQGHIYSSLFTSNINNTNRQFMPWTHLQSLISNISRIHNTTKFRDSVGCMLVYDSEI